GETFAPPPLDPLSARALVVPARAATAMARAATARSFAPRLRAFVPVLSDQSTLLRTPVGSIPSVIFDPFSFLIQVGPEPQVAPVRRERVTRNHRRSRAWLAYPSKGGALAVRDRGIYKSQRGPAARRLRHADAAGELAGD